jgi:hypothetical protein
MPLKNEWLRTNGYGITEISAGTGVIPLSCGTKITTLPVVGVGIKKNDHVSVPVTLVLKVANGLKGGQHHRCGHQHKYLLNRYL